MALIILLFTVISNAETWKELLDRADSLYKAANYDSSIVLGELALEKATVRFGEIDTTTATVMHHLAIYNELVADYSESERLFKKALSIRKLKLGQNHPDVIKSTNGLAVVYHRQGRYSIAESLYVYALDVIEDSIGIQHPYGRAIMSNLATVYRDLDRYVEAESLLMRVVKIEEELVGHEHINVSYALNNLGNVLKDEGKYSDAEEAYLRVLAIREKYPDKDRAALANILNNLALLYNIRGRYVLAESLNVRALYLRKELHEEIHPDIALSQNNLALVYRNLGQSEMAETFLKQALRIYEQSVGVDHPDYLRCLSNIALVYWDQEKYSESEEMYRKVLSGYDMTVGSGHSKYALTLNNIGILYQVQRKFPEAELALQEAISIYENTVGSNHPDYARSLNNLASIYVNQENVLAAESLFNRALTIRENVLGANHPLVAEGIEEFSRSIRDNSGTESYIRLSERAFRIRMGNYQKNVNILSDADALRYSRLFRNSAHICLTHCWRKGFKDSLSKKLATDVILSSKGCVWDNLYRRSLVPENERDSSTYELEELYRLARFQISKLLYQVPDEEAIDTYRHELDSLNALANELEIELTRKSASFRKRQYHAEVNSVRIQTLLTGNSVLVEFLKYSFYQIIPDSIIPRYLVLVLDNTGTPFITDIGESSEIDSLIEKYRKHIAGMSTSGHQPLATDKSVYEVIAGALYNAVIKPVETHLEGKDLVFIAPDGGLNLISFAGLVDASGNYLIEKYPIHYLSAGRDLIRLKDKDKSGSGLFALGDPDYNMSIAIEIPKIPSEDIAADATFYTYRNVRSGSKDLSELVVSPLPGSRREVEGIARLWEAENSEPFLVYFGSEATEDNFKSQSPGKKAIHLATHGYYLQGWDISNKEKSGMTIDQMIVGENPLLLSGLLFAGANDHGKRADSLGIDDGILTAYEVSAMDLTGVDLVVLSACETGLGKVEQGEGVNGLRRAFQMAGARTVVSALWPVPDKPTSEMMAGLYSHSNKPLPERIRNMQLAQIKKLRAEGFSDHPYTWAGFIALGDWR
jgi:CHAT domain-containing protein/tetratricopeptide (TPR) repeat protein